MPKKRSSNKRHYFTKVHEQAIIDYQVVVYISTVLTRNEIESEFEPEYKLVKLERLDQETEDDSE